MIKEKPKLAFVDLAIHEVTQSSYFIRDLFQEQFDIVNIWYNYGKEEEKCIEEIYKYEHVFLLQILLPYSALIRLQQAGKKIVWAPMYDGLPMSHYYWEKIASTNIKILSFSEGIDRKCSKHQIDFVPVRYYKKPAETIAPLEKDKFIFYFWYRGSIQFTDWIQMIPEAIIEKIYYYSAPLGSTFKSEVISPEEISRYKIEMIALEEFSVNRNIFLEYLAKTDVFVCPRRQDGIGLPLIEALSFGKFLLGNNDFTMKDYIRHGENGILYTPGSSIQLDPALIRYSLSFRQKYAVQGYENWKVDEGKVKNLYSQLQFTPFRRPGFKAYGIMVYEWAKKIAKQVLKKNN
jgi:hypothetical protein